MLPRVEQERVLIVALTSGNSPNEVVTVNDAQPCGVVIFGVAGFDSQAVKNRAEGCLWLESKIDVDGPVEFTHATSCGILNTCLMRDRPAMAEVP